MWKISFKPLTLIVLSVLYMQDVQTKECFSCEGINCLRTTKVNEKAACNDPLDNCVTVFEESTIIARGCYSKLPEAYRKKCDNNSDGNCLTCYTSLCNDRGAIACLQCDSKQNSDCNSGITNIASTRCPASTSTNSYCYTRKSLGHIERGCLTDSVEQMKCLADTSCSICLPGSSEDDACNRDVGNDATESSASQIAVYSTLTSLTWFIITLI